MAVAMKGEEEFVVMLTDMLCFERGFVTEVLSGVLRNREAMSTGRVVFVVRDNPVVPTALAAAIASNTSERRLAEAAGRAEVERTADTIREVASAAAWTGWVAPVVRGERGSIVRVEESISSHPNQNPNKLQNPNENRITDELPLG